MGLPNKCYGCDHYEGLSRGGDGTNILCGISGSNEIRNGVVGCNRFNPDSAAGVGRQKSIILTKKYHTNQKSIILLIIQAMLNK